MLKQYVFVPRRLKMSKGKMASQVAHATFMALDKENVHLINKWKNEGMCVIVLECEDTNHLLQIDKYLEQWKVVHHMYVDEGYTEVLPMTATALATGIMQESDAWMFANFKLFKG